jgi:uncharacterized membrane protein
MMPCSGSINEHHLSKRVGRLMKRRFHPFKNLFFVFFICYFIWIVLLFAGPFVLPTGSVTNLSGVVGFSDNEAVINDLPFPWNGIYSIGDRLCHQKPERSLFINGNEMPFCTRCVAIWLGLAFGLGFMVFFTIELNEMFFYAIIVSLIPLGIDGVGQLFGFWESTNIVRLLTGIPAGITCGVAVGIIIDEIRSLQFFRKNDVKKP